MKKGIGAVVVSLVASLIPLAVFGFFRPEILGVVVPIAVVVVAGHAVWGRRVVQKK